MIDIATLKHLIQLVATYKNGVTYKTICLLGYFLLSNLVPHAIREIDRSRHFAGGDMLFEKKTEVKLLLKWCKTMQTIDQSNVG